MKRLSAYKTATKTSDDSATESGNEESKTQILPSHPHPKVSANDVSDTDEEENEPQKLIISSKYFSSSNASGTSTPSSSRTNMPVINENLVAPLSSNGNTTTATTFKVAKSLPTVLEGSVVYFVGIQDPETARQIGRRVIAYGGQVMDQLNESVTHLVCGYDNDGVASFVSPRESCACFLAVVSPIANCSIVDCDSLRHVRCHQM